MRRIRIARRRYSNRQVFFQWIRFFLVVFNIAGREARERDEDHLRRLRAEKIATDTVVSLRRSEKVANDVVLGDLKIEKMRQELGITDDPGLSLDR